MRSNWILFSTPAIGTPLNQSTHQSNGNLDTEITDDSSIRSNDQGSTTRNAMHMARLFLTKDKKYSGFNDDSHYMSTIYENSSSNTQRIALEH